jgi:hypothetical protein
MNARVLGIGTRNQMPATPLRIDLGTDSDRINQPQSLDSTIKYRPAQFLDNGACCQHIKHLRVT